MVREQYRGSVTPYGVGLNEEQLHIATGLRNKSVSAVISTEIGGITFLPIGYNSGTSPAQNEWTGPHVVATQYSSMRAAAEATAAPWNEQLPVPMTPTIGIVSYCAGSIAVATAGTGSATHKMRFRVTGLDQFMNVIEEITPEITIPDTGYTALSKADYYHVIHLSKVFSAVFDVQYKNYGASTGADGHLNSSVSLFYLGWSTVIQDQSAAGNLNGSAAAANIRPPGFPIAVDTGIKIYGHGNWGIGTPVRVSPYGPASPYAAPEIMGATLIHLRNKTAPTVVNAVVKLPIRGQTLAGASPTAGLAIGRSAAGWQGCPNKIGFFSNDDWAAERISGITLSGSDTEASNRPNAWAEQGEDELQLTALIRTTTGSRRGGSSVTSYPRG